MAGNNLEALGMIETKGLVALIEASDAMLKAAKVEFVGWKKVGSALCTAFVSGDVASVKAAVDAGAAAARMLGRVVPGSGHLGVRGTDLQALPKTSVDVDGSKAFITLEISVRWPASVPDVAEQVRSHVRDRVRELAGLDVDEVHIVIADLATDIVPPPRAR